jgi:acyl-CoA synthetase (AMP-forming)/AMP-acid ligase II
LDDTALRQSTGGTTGISRGSILNQRNLVANLIQVAEWRTGVVPVKEVMLCVLPFFHVHGLQEGTRNSVYNCGAAVLFPRFEIDTVYTAIDKYKLTTIHGVPAMCNAIRLNPEYRSKNRRTRRSQKGNAAGKVGEVAIKGPQVFQGYRHRADDLSNVLNDGWFISGDIGRMDEESSFYLVERRKDMINVGGFKVFQLDME